MPVRRKPGSFLWQHFLENATETIIVLPSPHGEYKDGISYCDACAMGKIYARLQHLTDLDVRMPEQVGSEIKKNLILISGPKTNPLTKELYASQAMAWKLKLDDGVIYDKEQQMVVTPQYLPGKTRRLEDLTTDYGVIVYMDNPFGSHSKVLHLAGIRGCGTVAAALAITEEKFLHRIEECLADQLNPGRYPKSKPHAVEILVKVNAREGKVDPVTLSLEMLTCKSRRKSWSWKSTTYQQLQHVPPHKFSITLNGKDEQELSLAAVTIDDLELKCVRSPDRRRLLYVLAKQSREEYLARSESAGWVMGSDLAKELWNINTESGASELSPGLRRLVSDSIITWARHLSKKRLLTLDEKITLDHHYVNSEILIFEHDLKKRVTDLVYGINHDAKTTFGKDFHLIETQHGRGYRLNIHPALISITHLAPK